MIDSDLTVVFQGPYSWHGSDNTVDISKADVGRKCGIYLWTLEYDEGELIYYVGETGRTFSVRMFEHFKEHMSGGYHLHDPSEMIQGRKRELWPGRYGRGQQVTVAEFLAKFKDLRESIERLARLYRFFLAPMQVDTRVRQRIEAGLANHLYKQVGIVGEFQDSGIRYRPRQEAEPLVRVAFQSQLKLLGLPDTLVGRLA
jgi:hypothetical protein